MPTSLSQC